MSIELHQWSCSCPSWCDGVTTVLQAGLGCETHKGLWHGCIDIVPAADKAAAGRVACFASGLY